LVGGIRYHAIMPRFSEFACIDWSGALGEHHRGIALAITAGEHKVELINPPAAKGWSRAAILDWLSNIAANDRPTLIGIDLSLGFPFVDTGAYFPGWDNSPVNAPELWRMVDTLCADDPHLSMTSLLSHPDAARHFRQTGQQGDAFIGSMGRLRVTEAGQAAMGLRPYSCFNLVGAAQVGKASLTGMRVLHRLRGTIPVWPFDPLPATGPVIVEIYTALAAMAAGRRPGRSKMRDASTLIVALETFSAEAALPQIISDHISDAMLTAAWLRTVADNPALWSPRNLTTDIAITEGWTFGVF
jgi:hypothetical protein